MQKFLLLFISIFALSQSCRPKSGNDLQVVKGVISRDVANDHKEYVINKYGDTIRKVVRTEAEWKKLLSEPEYQVLREKGTERAFTGDLTDNKVEGLYTCRGCGIPLFASKHKFDSGSGWPSFYDVIDPALIRKDTDHLLGYARTELSCAKCGGHLGHVFDDVPKPTGLRYCINSVSLDFIKTEH